MGRVRVELGVWMHVSWSMMYMRADLMALARAGSAMVASGQMATEDVTADTASGWTGRVK